MFRKIEFEFASVQPRTVWTAGTLLIGGGLVLLILLIRLFDAWLEPAAVTTADANALATSAAIQPIAPEQIVSANRVIDALTWPWTELLDAVESARDESITLTGVHLDADQGILRVVGSAHDVPAITQFTQQLRKQKSTATAQLIRHAASDADTSATLTQFEIVIPWR